MAIAGKKIIITGGAGFIGYHLSKRLLEQGMTVVGIDNMNSYYEVSLKESRLTLLKNFSKYDFYRQDVVDKEGLSIIFEKEKPDIVINLAAQAGVRYSIENPQAYIDSNIVGFFNILEACRAYPVKHLVYASSSSVYGNQKKTPFSVTDNVDKPISLYAATKKSNELMAYTYSHLYHIPATGLRFFTVYGPMGRPDMAYFSFTRKILAEEPIQLFNNGDMYRDFTYIDDIIAGIVNILSKPPKPDEMGVRHKLYNIGKNKPEKLSHFIEILEEKLEKKATKVFLPMQPGDVYQTFADTTELERDFGFKPEIDIETGIQRFVEWYLQYYNIGAENRKESREK